jgi:hypothetical protein
VGDTKGAVDYKIREGEEGWSCECSEKCSVTGWSMGANGRCPGTSGDRALEEGANRDVEGTGREKMRRGAQGEEKVKRPPRRRHRLTCRREGCTESDR